MTVLKQAFNVDPLLQGQADCISTMTYNEYGQILDAGYAEEELVNFNYLEQGVGMLEDGLYVLEENLEDEAFEDKMARFVRASMKGWKWAEENPEEAAADRRRQRHDRGPDARSPGLHDERGRPS